MASPTINALDTDGCILQRNPNYVGNPLIERLPDQATFTKAEKFYRAIEYYPPYHRKMRTAAPDLRRQLSEDAGRFFVPLKRHFKAAELIDTMIREGYRDRNPVDPRYWSTLGHRLNQLRKDLRKLVRLKKFGDRRGLGRASGLCRALFGISGVGKTVFINELLRLYEKQVIPQASYCEYPMNILQVVYIYIEVEKNGSTTALCRAFFREMDKVLKTNYLEDYGSLSVPLMLEHMANLTGAHALGLLVIDELQQLSNMKSGGGPGLLGFFLALTNTMKCPVLLIGTEESIPLVEARLQDARRTSGIPEWKPLTPKEFDIFWKALSQYDYTRVAADDKVIAQALYKESHGLTDLAVKIYITAQRMLIGSSHDCANEGITPEALHIAATTDHPRVLEVLKGKKLGGDTSTKAAGDCAPRRSTSTPAGAVQNAAEGNGPETKSEKTDSLLNRIVVSCNNSRACYDVLDEAGFIKSASEFLAE